MRKTNYRLAEELEATGEILLLNLTAGGSNVKLFRTPPDGLIHHALPRTVPDPCDAARTQRATVCGLHHHHPMVSRGPASRVTCPECLLGLRRGVEASVTEATITTSTTTA